MNAETITWPAAFAIVGCALAGAAALWAAAWASVQQMRAWKDKP